MAVFHPMPVGFLDDLGAGEVLRTKQESDACCGPHDGTWWGAASLCSSTCEAVGHCFPCVPQGKEIPQPRNVLVESARIARGKIAPLEELQASVDAHDAVVFPGGFGAAKCVPAGVSGNALEVY